MLKTKWSQVESRAKDMGLAVPNRMDELWLKRSYTTIIRNNWHLLPYAQLLTLLDWTSRQLDYNAFLLPINYRKVYSKYLILISEKLTQEDRHDFKR